MGRLEFSEIRHPNQELMADKLYRLNSIGKIKLLHTFVKHWRSIEIFKSVQFNGSCVPKVYLPSDL